MRRVWPFTARGTGALVLAVICLIAANELGLIELVYFGVLLLVALAASLGSLYLTRHAETVTRSLNPDVATVGHDAEVTLRAGVRTAVPTPPGIWSDVLPSGLTGRPEGVFPALGSGLSLTARTIVLTYTVRGVTRGVHALGPLTVRATDPFGLARRTTVFGERTPVTVVPAITDLPPLADFAGETGGTLHTTTNQLGQGADNLVARPYSPGDSMRRIHWRATAHRDQLMVRQEEQESTPEASVVLDRGVLRWSTDAMRVPGADPRFEAGVSMAVSAVARLVDDGYGVEVLDSDGTVIAERIDGGDMEEVEALITRTATLTARRDDTLAALPRVFAGVMTGPVIVIVGRFDAADVNVIAPVAHHSTLPMLLSTDPVGDALELAADRGWRVGAIGHGQDVAAAWATAAGRGVSRVVG